MPNSKKEDGVAITSTTLVKWGGFLVALVGGFITLVTWAAKIGAKVDQLEDRVALVDKESANRHERQEGEISELKQRVNNTDKTVGDLSRKIEVVIAILERIEKRVAVVSSEKP